jgi:hypothetical protein
MQIVFDNNEAQILFHTILCDSMYHGNDYNLKISYDEKTMKLLEII